MSGLVPPSGLQDVSAPLSISFFPCPELSLFSPQRVIVKAAKEAQQEVDFLQNKLDCCLVIYGKSLQVKTPCDGSHTSLAHMRFSCASPYSRMSLSKF